MAPQTEIKHAGVLGWPISHSLSPRLHNYWLKKYNIAGNYEAIAVAENDLESFLRTLPAQNFCGVNLTIPHKEHAFILVDEVDDIARRIGAINTITIKDGKLSGTNTDAYGFIENLKSQAPLIYSRENRGGGKALVLGAGGAARAICAGLLQEGWKVSLSGRTRSKAEAIAAHLKEKKLALTEWDDISTAMKEVTLLVNTTPLGMKGQLPLNISLEALPRSAAVYDIVYNPLETLLIAEARKRGNSVITGLGMLLYQAQPAFEGWFGIKPEVDEALYNYMAEALT